MIKKLTLLLGLLIGSQAFATVLVQDGFESWVAGSTLGNNTKPDWYATTLAFRIGNQPGLAATGTQYLSAPSRFGAPANTNLTRFGWYDASSAFNARDPGLDTIIGQVKMFIPNVTENTYGGMIMFDQSGGIIGVIGVDMATHNTLTSATTSVANIPVLLDAYNDIELRAHFDTGLIEYLVNGTMIGARQMSAPSMAAGFGDFDFYNNGFNALSSVAFRYDDYIVSAVAEPGSLSLFALGAFGLMPFMNRSRASAVRRRSAPLVC